jgi:hypothetical protein
MDLVRPTRKSLWWYYINTFIEFPDIIHCPVFLFKAHVSEIGFCLCLQVKAYSVGPNWQSQSLSPETESGLQNVVF